MPTRTSVEGGRRPQQHPPGRLSSCPRTRGKVRKGVPLAGSRTTAPPHLSKRGAGDAALAGGTGGVPLYPRRRVGRWDNGAGQSRPSADGGRKPQQIHPPRLCPTPIAKYDIAKYERLCCSTPMKWATGPLLFLGACRIHEHWGLTTENPPCGRSAEGTTQGARPSEEGWDRSECRCKAQASWSHPTP